MVAMSQIATRTTANYTPPLFDGQLTPPAIAFMPDGSLVTGVQVVSRPTALVGGTPTSIVVFQNLDPTTLAVLSEVIWTPRPIPLFRDPLLIVEGVTLTHVGGTSFLCVPAGVYNSGFESNPFCSCIVDMSSATITAANDTFDLGSSLPSSFAYGPGRFALYIPSLGIVVGGDSFIYSATSGLPIAYIPILEVGDVVGSWVNPADPTKCALVIGLTDAEVIVYLSDLGGSPFVDSTVDFTPSTFPPHVDGLAAVINAGSPYDPDAVHMFRAFDTPPTAEFLVCYSAAGELLSYTALDLSVALRTETLNPIPGPEGALSFGLITPMVAGLPDYAHTSMQVIAMGFPLILARIGILGFSAPDPTAPLAPIAVFPLHTTYYGATNGLVGVDARFAVVWYLLGRDPSVSYVVVWLFQGPVGDGLGAGVAPPMRLKQRNDGLGLTGHARLPLANGPSSVQYSKGPRLVKRRQYL